MRTVRNCVLMAAIVAGSAGAASKDLDTAMAEAESLAVVSQDQDEVQFDRQPMLSIELPVVHVSRPPGVSAGGMVGASILGGVIADGMVNASIMRAHNAQQRQLLAPFYAITDDATMLKTVNVALLDELSQALGRKIDRTSKVKGRFDPAVFVSRDPKLRDSMIIYLVPTLAFAEDKRSMRLALGFEIKQARSGRFSLVTKGTVSVQASPLAQRATHTIVATRAAAGGEPLLAELDAAARNAIRALVMAQRSKIEVQAATNILNPAGAYHVVGRVLERTPGQIVVDDGQGSRIAVYPVERYLE